MGTQTLSHPCEIPNSELAYAMYRLLSGTPHTRSARYVQCGIMGATDVRVWRQRDALGNRAEMAGEIIIQPMV